MHAEDKPETTVVVLGGPLEGTAKQFRDHDITPVLNSVEQVREWNELGRETGKMLPAILQFDTGMSRSGIAPEDRAKVAHGGDALEYVDVKYVMSHLARNSPRRFRSLRCINSPLLQQSRSRLPLR